MLVLVWTLLAATPQTWNFDLGPDERPDRLGDEQVNRARQGKVFGCRLGRRHPLHLPPGVELVDHAPDELASMQQQHPDVRPRPPGESV